MNISNFDECPEDSDVVRTVKVMSIMLVAGIGVFGNVLVILIAVKYTRQSNIHHLIVNMAVADTLIILLYTFRFVPALILKYHWWDLPNVGIDSYFCKLIIFMEYTCSAVTLLTLVIISIERYRATRVTALRLRPYTKRQRIATVTCSWILSMAFYLFSFFSIEAHSKNGFYVCEYLVYSIIYQIWIITSFIVSISSFCVILVLSILISQQLKRPSVVQTNLSDVQRKVRAKRITNAVRMVVCSVLVYGCCNFLFFIWNALCLEHSITVGFSFVAFSLECNLWIFLFLNYFLVFLNSCLSPYIYIIFLSEFREIAKRLLFSKQRPAEQTSLELGAVIEKPGTHNRDKFQSGMKH